MTAAEPLHEKIGKNRQLFGGLGSGIAIALQAARVSGPRTVS